MATVQMTAARREGTGKGAARKLRAQEKFPAVLYGHGEDPLHLTFDAVEFRKAISTRSGTRAVFNLQVDGDTKVALIREIQRHPVSHQFLHADMIAIRLDEPVEVTVPIHPEGVSPGVKNDGGVIEWARRELPIRVLPTKIPEAIVVDISGLELNQAIHISDLDVDFEILEEPERTICAVHTVRLMVEDTEGEEGAVGEVAEGEEAAEGEEPEGEEGDGEEKDGE